MCVYIYNIYIYVKLCLFASMVRSEGCITYRYIYIDVNDFVNTIFLTAVL